MKKSKGNIVARLIFISLYCAIFFLKTINCISLVIKINEDELKNYYSAKYNEFMPNSTDEDISSDISRYKNRDFYTEDFSRTSVDVTDFETTNSDESLISDASTGNVQSVSLTYDVLSYNDTDKPKKNYFRSNQRSKNEETGIKYSIMDQNNTANNINLTHLYAHMNNSLQLASENASKNDTSTHTLNAKNNYDEDFSHIYESKSDKPVSNHTLELNILPNEVTDIPMQSETINDNFLREDSTTETIVDLPTTISYLGNSSLTFLKNFASISNRSSRSFKTDGNESYPSTNSTISQKADSVEERKEPNNSNLERTLPVSRIALLPKFPGTENPAVKETTNQGNITTDELRSIISKMRTGRAGVKFKETSDTKRCETSEGNVGTCVPLMECKEALDNLKRQMPVICEWINDQPVICCPSPTLSRKFEVVGCGTRQIKGLNRFARQAPRTIPGFPLPTSGGRSPTVAGGTESRIGSWPWMAGIYTRNFGGENFLCGAAIINDKHLVTAAHCFSTRGGGNVQPTRYSVRVGSSNILQGTLYLVDSITIHPQYLPRQHYNDIAVVRLKEPIKFDGNTRPICLPTGDDIRRKRLQGKDVTVTGWGDIEFGGKSASVLREVTVQVVDIPSCDESYKNVRGRSITRGITKQFICAGTAEGGKDACSRDSGGPLMLLEKGVYFLVGVVSFGFQCARPGYPGVYTRITHYLDWLEEVVANE